MNDINKIVFDVYNGVLEMDYTKNNKTNFVKNFKKLFRYFISGYIFKVKKNSRLMLKNNKFTSSFEEEFKGRLAVYTVCSGMYDIIKEPIFVDDRIDYFVITDQEISNDSVWKKIEIPKEIQSFSNLAKARYIKTHPDLFFSKYEYSVFIDGNVRITCDIYPILNTLISSNKVIAIHRHQCRDCIYEEGKAVYAVGKAKRKDIKNQLSTYNKEGFPKHYGLFETNIIFRKHNDKNCKKIMNDWWNQMSKFTKRDQLSFTYALWRNNLQSDFVLSLGNNSRRNPYFIVDSHK